MIILSPKNFSAPLHRHPQMAENLAMRLRQLLAL
jgi:hypothetical protein